MNAIPFKVAEDLPIYDERRPVLRTRPLKAFHHFRELLKDKERTDEVFKIFEALPWRGFVAAAKKFLSFFLFFYLPLIYDCWRLFFWS